MTDKERYHSRRLCELSAASPVKRHTAESVLQFLKLHTVELPHGDMSKALESLPDEMIASLSSAVAFDLHDIRCLTNSYAQTFEQTALPGI